ncbi:hypothetical protein CerSpe_074300 [Prunus speciosa]
MSMSVVDIEQSFDSSLVLTPCEKTGMIIGSSNVAYNFVGFIYGLVAQVLTDKHVTCDGFIKTLGASCRSGDVSIKEIGSNKYWVRFVCDRDKKRVLDMVPCAFWRSLILLANIPDNGNLHSMPLSLGTFWVQLHGVPGFYMTVIVAKAIGAIPREVL